MNTSQLLDEAKASIGRKPLRGKRTSVTTPRSQYYRQPCTHPEKDAERKQRCFERMQEKARIANGGGR